MSDTLTILSKPQLSEDDVVVLGAAFSDLVETEGWALYEQLLRKREMSLGREGLRDTTHERDYWVGRMDEALAAIEDVRRIVAHARVARDSVRQGRHLQVINRIGGADPLA